MLIYDNNTFYLALDFVNDPVCVWGWGQIQNLHPDEDPTFLIASHITRVGVYITDYPNSLFFPDVRISTTARSTCVHLLWLPLASC